MSEFEGKEFIGLPDEHVFDNNFIADYYREWICSGPFDIGKTTS